MNQAFEPLAVVKAAMVAPGLLAWDQLCAGTSAVVRLAENNPVHVGAPVPLPENPEMPRGLSLALASIARLDIDPHRPRGLVLGLPSLLSETRYVEHSLKHRNDPKQMARVAHYSGQNPLQLLAKQLPGVGPRVRVDSACATGNDALICAADWIHGGLVDEVLVVCASAMLNPVGLALFHNLKALNDQDDLAASKPFDRNRRGFVMGEGAAAVVLRKQDKGAALGWLCGGGRSMNAASFTDLPDDLSAMARACTDALEGYPTPAYISAHGTSTPANDVAETRLYRRIFGADADRVPISSIKSMIGHTLGAAALIEAIVCLHAVRDQKAPPTINLTTPDPDCDLNVTPNVAAPINGNFALSNAFAFGGHNSSVLLAGERP